MTGPTITFEPPGKGEWRSLRDHFPRALTPEYARLLPAAMNAGEALVMEEYGLPVRSLVAGLSQGHVYIAPEPLLGKPSDAQPPKAALWVATRLVPAFRRRTRAAARCLAERPWLDDARRWYATEQSTWVAANRTLQAEAPDDMDAPALIDHLRRARAHARAGYERHFALHGPDLMPTGLLIARAGDWGIGPELLFPVLAGASPTSTGRGPALEALRSAVARSGREPSTMDELRECAGPDLDAFLDEHGWRLVTGYDIDALALVELPSLVVNLARSKPSGPIDEDEAAAAVEVLADKAGATNRDELDRLVGDARATVGLRDDNGAVTAAWPAGLLRRAMLAAGRRLVERGALADVDHAIEVTVDELVGLLEGTSPLDGAAVGRRAEERAARSELVPPLQLGPSADIPVDVLPAPMRTMSRALFALREVATAPTSARASLDGDGIGSAVFQGRARVATDPADALNRLEPGDVLVAFGTTPAYNMVLSIVGAVVVEEGGLFSHAAVIARELGLSAVIGAAGAMAEIPDGALVEVDPVAGRVRVLDGAA